MSRILHFVIEDDASIDLVLTQIQEDFPDVPMVFIYDTSYGKNVRHKALIVREWSTGFDIWNIESGRDHWISDGVDWLHDEDGDAYSPGQPDFYSAIGEWLKSDYDEIVEAYNLGENEFWDGKIKQILNAPQDQVMDVFDQFVTEAMETGNFFRKINPDEESEWRQWARDNYIPGEEINTLWHPLVQDECRKMNEEDK